MPISGNSDPTDDFRTGDDFEPKKMLQTDTGLYSIKSENQDFAQYV